MPTANKAESFQPAGVTPELSPITEAFRFIGLNVLSIKRLAATDRAFPPLIRLSAKKVLVDIPATAAYLRAQAGKAPRSIRGDAESAKQKAGV